MSKQTKKNPKNDKKKNEKEEKTKGPKLSKRPSATQLKKPTSKTSVTAVDKKVELKKSKSTITATKEEKTITVTKTCTSPTKEKKKEKEKWSGEDAASAWAKSLEALNVITEYEDILKACPTQEERCKIWSENMARNRHQDYKCYDDNRVIVQMSKCDYVNATKINVPNFPRVVFLGQMPKLDVVDNVEEFWRMIFTEQCTTVHIIAQPSELEEGFDKLFGQETGKYFYANGFFVNTRKVERNASEKLDTFVVELLPDGCSNSVMCQVYVHTYWKAQGGPEKFHAPVKSAQLISKLDDNNPVAIVSVRGAGRNASLLTLAVASAQLTKGIEPKIGHIVRAIREQRPMSVDSVTQYISIYLATSWLVKAKVSPNASEILNRLKKFRAKCDPSSSLMSMATFEETKEVH